MVGQIVECYIKVKSRLVWIKIMFINDNQFTFQPRCKEQMQMYEMDSNTKQYRKTKEIAVKCGSNGCSIVPQQYLKSKCLLVNKNGNYVNLMRNQENDDFIIEQSIEFGHQSIYGQLSQDGEYLITWDCGSKEIQQESVRRNEKKNEILLNQESNQDRKMGYNKFKISKQVKESRVQSSFQFLVSSFYTQEHSIKIKSWQMGYFLQN
ncbi:unnamed protein product [Paramecium sonneborni]|uniref:Uncharacterized protein n=1 Tax=Paramecium sonneborni TaxID=65129 RepID=A0A8S1RRE0_9CILI|nr:unnamed protein product [Paramecium sonneborni]